MAMIDAMLAELDQESQATRRLLDRVPEERLSWKPHPKSFSLGQIALHLAELPGGVSSMAAEEVYQVPRFQQKEAESRAELLQAFERGLSTAREVLGRMDDQQLMGTWTLQNEGQVLMSLPRAALLRSILLNHYYHHRGQLTVYLRLLNVPLPSTYGPTADENPFAQAAASARTEPAAV
jgi:uncharacterized damage-inducible protein DinB